MGKKKKIKKKIKGDKINLVSNKKQYQECCQFLLNVMHDNKPNNFYIKHFFIIFQIKKLQRLFDTFVSLGIYSILFFLHYYLCFLFFYLFLDYFCGKSFIT
jgi:hypothetical protein